MRYLKFLVVALFISAMVQPNSSYAAIVLFDLQGKAGFGLLSGNENATINGTPGTGGENGAGISYDDVTNILTLNVGWGSADGFLGQLTGTATAMHLHGPATFVQNNSVVIGLDNLVGFSNLANGGGFNGTVAVPAAQEANLLAGLLYVNVHTAAGGGGLNGGGELRGNLVVVPEPSSLALLMAGGVFGLVGRRRRMLFK